MITCRDIIKTALRKVGATSRGREPKDHQAREALEALQSMYLEWAQGGMFGRLTPVTVTSDYTAAEGQRIYVDTDLDVEIVLPDVVQPEGEDERTAFDLAVIQITGPNPALYIRDANLSAWLAVNDLELSSEAPLASWGTDSLACCLAKRLADEYGPALGAQSEASAARFVSRLSHRRTSDTAESHWF